MVLEVTTMPISESVPCHAVAARAPASARIAHDRGGTPKPFLQKVVRKVLQSGLDAPIVLAGNEHEPVGAADLAREPFKGLGRFAFRIFLVHPVEHREADRLGVDQLDVVASASQPLDDILRQPDTHPIGTIGAVKDEDAVVQGKPPDRGKRT